MSHRLELDADGYVATAYHHLEPADGETYFDGYEATPDDHRDEAGAYQWWLNPSTKAVERKRRPWSAEEKAVVVSGRMAREYPQDRWNEIMANAEEARMDGAAADDDAFVALKAMQNRKRAIAEEVDAL
ncbi:hypothetical protein [uncultured Mediterranean phage uvDeep-CGR2-KM21-C88]|nr:hypothetical protein [uncultured Mediterranean phage uvDeep-CGR2-KM21-C88]